MIWLFLDDGVNDKEGDGDHSHRARVVRGQAQPGQVLDWCPSTRTCWSVSSEVQDWMDLMGLEDYELAWKVTSLATRDGFHRAWMVGIEDPQLAMLFKLRWSV